MGWVGLSSFLIGVCRLEDSKKRAFPRFYFMSSNDLLDVLSNGALLQRSGSDPEDRAREKGGHLRHGSSCPGCCGDRARPRHATQMEHLPIRCSSILVFFFVGGKARALKPRQGTVRAAPQYMFTAQCFIFWTPERAALGSPCFPQTKPSFWIPLRYESPQYSVAQWRPFYFFLGKGCPLNSTNQKRMPFFFMATGHLRITCT